MREAEGSGSVQKEARQAALALHESAPRMQKMLAGNEGSNEKGGGGYSMKFIADAKCSSCGGTGLYVGLAEKDGAAVVCNTCDGTGCEKIVINYTPFDHRIKPSNVLHVFQVNPGICIGSGGDKKLKLSDFGGMPFKDWADGKPFPPKSEDRKFTCPAWWYQSANYEKKPHWDECIGYGSFSQCPSFKDKAGCWERFDREQKGGGK